MEAALVGALQLMLPDAEDAPAEGAEGAGDESVAGAVGGNLLLPEGGVRFRRRGVERAAVPEAAVDEDGEAVSPEDKVGFHAEAFFVRADGGTVETRSCSRSAISYERKAWRIEKRSTKNLLRSEKTWHGVLIVAETVKLFWQQRKQLIRIRSVEVKSTV